MQIARTLDFIKYEYVFPRLSLHNEIHGVIKMQNYCVVDTAKASSSVFIIQYSCLWTRLTRFPTR